MAYWLLSHLYALSNNLHTVEPRKNECQATCCRGCCCCCCCCHCCPRRCVVIDVFFFHHVMNNWKRSSSAQKNKDDRYTANLVKWCCWYQYQFRLAKQLGKVDDEKSARLYRKSGVSLTGWQTHRLTEQRTKPSVFATYNLTCETELSLKLVYTSFDIISQRHHNGNDALLGYVHSFNHSFIKPFHYSLFIHSFVFSFIYSISIWLWNNLSIFSYITNSFLLMNR